MICRKNSILVHVLFFVVILCIVFIPIVFFKLSDHNIREVYEISDLSFSNLYNNELSVMEKLEILSDSSATCVTLTQGIDKGDYKHILEIIDEELKKIDGSLANNFKMNFVVDYNNLYQINVEKKFFTNGNDASFALLIFEYYNDNVQLKCILDVNSHTIFFLNVNFLNGIYDEANYIDLSNLYFNYLGISDGHVDTILTDKSILLDCLSGSYMHFNRFFYDDFM